MPKKNDPLRLSPKQQAFVDEYLRSYSPANAALAAGYSSKQPHKIGYQVMQSEAVKAAIKAESDKRKRVLNEIPFESILLHLIEVVNDESLKPNERMKAADLLIKYKSQNKWNASDAVQVDKYVEALKEGIGEVWNADK